jgi:beta-lactamase class C
MRQRRDGCGTSVALDERHDETRHQRWQPDAAPGAQRRYSNPSLGLLGHLTGIALNQDFRQAIESRIFSELRLSGRAPPR